MKLKQKVKELIEEWFFGLFTSWNFSSVFSYILGSRLIQKRLFQCSLVNGILFIGSIYIFDYIITPFLHSIFNTNDYFITLLFSSVYYLFWLFPLYIISFCLTTFWVQDIFNEGFKFCYHKKVPKLRVSYQRFISDQIKRIIIIGFFLVQILIISIIPYIGKLLEIIYVSWLYAYYCLEYRTIALRFSVQKSIRLFEVNSVFFSGFGFPFTLIVIFFPGMMSSGVFALIFPFLVLTSVPMKVGNKPNAFPVPIFAFPKLLYSIFTSFLNNYLNNLDKTS